MEQKGIPIAEKESVRLYKNGKCEEVTDKVFAPMPMEQWIQAINKGTEPTLKEKDFYNLTLMNQAAALSNETGKRVMLQKK